MEIDDEAPILEDNLKFLRNLIYYVFAVMTQ